MMVFAMKLCCFDIDNTILPFGHRVLSPKTKAALNALLRQGDAVCLASGRPFIGAKQYLETLVPGKKYEIVSNGSAIYSFEGELLYDQPMKPHDVYYFYDHYGHIPGVTVYAFGEHNNLIVFGQSPFLKIEERLNHMTNQINFLKEDHRNDETIKIQKIMVASDPEISKNLHLTAEEEKRYFASRSAPPYFEILPQGASKGAMVERLRLYLGLQPEDVYCFGDGDNDISMLRKFTSVASANALPSVKEVATFVTRDCRDDGVASAITDLLHLIK